MSIIHNCVCQFFFAMAKSNIFQFIPLLSTNSCLRGLLFQQALFSSVFHSAVMRRLSACRRMLGAVFIGRLVSRKIPLRGQAAAARSRSAKVRPSRHKRNPALHSRPIFPRAGHGHRCRTGVKRKNRELAGALW